ncbi:helix-turn-helix domain-containing protein [Nocardia transvalensis]|uniref:helix-turn-helix domain-containing protein n=1 Tax=Nocardia transvalensis TaxID=37333 RepID=UPI00189461FF|nr:helix-turn-helix transcriptional regulator [Nocardia transvalensis]MBF6329865.1 helix-turn-helix domain-containing protein [Nocardia transvalensis]
MIEEEPGDTGSPLSRRQLGRYLREAREAAGMTLQQAANLMEWGKTTVQNLETARNQKVHWRNVRDLCEIYGCNEDRTAALIDLAKQIPTKSWWHAYGDLVPATFNLYLDLEAATQQLTIFQPLIIPGLLQTADYARTLDRRFFSHETEEELNRRIQLRLQRQHILTRQRKPAKLRAVIHESALRTVVGNRRIMDVQVRHIADMSTRPNVEIRVLTYEAGFPVGMPLPAFVIMDFGLDPRGKPVEQTIVFAESFTGGMYFERSTDVQRFQEAFEEVWEASLDVRPSRDLMREIAREFRSGR